VRQVIPLVGASKADWRSSARWPPPWGIDGFSFASAEAIWQEVRCACVERAA
jgi:hypothetical protein